MLLLAFLMALAPALGAELVCDSCVRLGAACYNATYLLDFTSPFRSKVIIHEMGILRETNTLFYSFEPEIADPEYYKIGFVNLDDPNSSGVLSGNNKLIVNFGTFDIDNDRGFMYLGGSNGIYELDTKSHKLQPYSSKGDTILSVFFKEFVYFARDGAKSVTRKRGNDFEAYLEEVPVKKFVINREYVFVYLSSYGLFARKENETVQLSNNPFFRGIDLDLDGNVYTWWIDAIYRVYIEKEFAKSYLQKIARISKIGAITFDNDNNLLFTIDRSLYRLEATDNTTICEP